MKWIARWWTFAGCAAVLSGCTGVTHPAAEESESVAHFWWFLLGLAALATAMVLVLIGIALRHSRRRSAEEDVERRAASLSGTRGHAAVLVLGAVLPAVVLTCVFVVSLPGLNRVAREGSPRDADVVVDVTAHRWWWEVSYSGSSAETANEIHVPVGKDVLIRLRSPDVIHSFWVPELAGKTDVVPGQVNRMRLRVNKAGTYEGRCAEYCGLQHAHMGFLVVAQDPGTFGRWLQQQARPATDPVGGSARAGQQVFLGSACVYCHAVRGTNSSSDFGPDLTHLATRRRLAAGILPNNRGNLGGWLTDPQHVKPGNLMPQIDLSPDELNALLDYLETLK